MTCMNSRLIFVYVESEIYIILSTGISFDVRKLNVGDFAWIARKKAVLDSGITRRS